MPALRDSEGALRRMRLEWKAGLSRSGGSTSACLARVVVFDFHGPSQPVENVGPMPADRLSAVGALLRESSEYREAEKQPARATGQARDLACAKYCAQVRKRFVDPPRQAKVLRRANDCRGDSGAFIGRSGIHSLASSRDVMGSRMRRRDAKSSAQIQGRDGPNAARMYDSFRVCSRFSG